MGRREKISRGVWKSPEQRGKEVDWTRPTDWIRTGLSPRASGEHGCGLEVYVKKSRGF